MPFYVFTIVACWFYAVLVAVYVQDDPNVSSIHVHIDLTKQV